MSQMGNALDVFAKVVVGVIGLGLLIGGGVCVVTDVIGIASLGFKGEAAAYSVMLLIALAVALGMAGGGWMMLKGLINQGQSAKPVYRDRPVPSDQAQKNSDSNGNDSENDSGT